MKISLHAEFDSAEEYSAFVDMLVARPVAVRPFNPQPLADTQYETDGSGVLQPQENWGGPEPDEKQPEQPPAPPKLPTEPKPQPEEPEPAAAVKAKRTRRTKAEMQAAQAAEATVAASMAKAATAAKAEAAAQAAAAPKKGNGKKVYTREDLSGAFTAYVQKFGMAAAQADINKLLVNQFGPNVRRVSDVSEDQIAAAIEMAQKALVENPFQRGQ